MLQCNKVHIISVFENILTMLLELHANIVRYSFLMRPVVSHLSYVDIDGLSHSNVVIVKNRYV